MYISKDFLGFDFTTMLLFVSMFLQKESQLSSVCSFVKAGPVRQCMGNAAKRVLYQV